MSRALRIFAVTVGLLAAGAVAGALAAVAAITIAFVVSGESVGMYLHADREMFAIVAMIGALFGGVLLPATAWIFLRRVPLGLALLGTVVGTILGGSLGWIVMHGGGEIQGGLVGAFTGFAGAALLLRLRASAPPRVRRVVT
jgi:hypothetical protein